MAASIAFLIARYFARERILKLVEGNKKFLAIDKAIGENGFRVVTLLRLSPLLPFSLGNYLYGLTSVKFVPYVLGRLVFCLFCFQFCCSCFGYRINWYMICRLVFHFTSSQNLLVFLDSSSFAWILLYIVLGYFTISCICRLYVTSHPGQQYWNFVALERAEKDFAKSSIWLHCGSKWEIMHFFYIR